LAENNVVHGPLYRCGDAWQERPVIVLLHAGGDIFLSTHLGHTGTVMSSSKVEQKQPSRDAGNKSCAVSAVIRTACQRHQSGRGKHSRNAHASRRRVLVVVSRSPTEDALQARLSAPCVVKSGGGEMPGRNGF
jgi:hypothetical protein